MNSELYKERIQHTLHSPSNNTYYLCTINHMFALSENFATSERQKRCHLQHL